MEYESIKEQNSLCQICGAIYVSKSKYNKHLLINHLNEVMNGEASFRARVYEISKTLGIGSKQIIEAAEQAGCKISSPSNHIPIELLREVIKNLARDKKSVSPKTSKSLPPTVEYSLIETPPPPSRSKRTSITRKSRPRKSFNYLESEALNHSLGLAGEFLVLESEKEFLTKNGRAEFAARVCHTSLVEGDGAGYDIQSFTLKGEVKYIEVKTTSGAIRASFYITSNELKFAKQHQENYYLYRVYDYDKDTNSGKVYVIAGDVEELFILTPTHYRVECL